MELCKGIGDPDAVAERLGLAGRKGTHAVAHTRMATESAVTTEGSHPFSTGADTCLVHNGSMSNHNGLRENLRKRGETFQTENDSEVAAGYLAWRKAQAEHHAQVVAELMSEAGYDQAEIDAARRMLRKQGIKRDDDVQALEDVICFVFLKWYFAPFATKHSDEKIQRIVEKTARKMSAEARRRVLDEFDLPEDLASAFKD